MKPSKLLIAAASLSAATTLLHVFGGGPEFLEVIFAVDEIDLKQKALYAILWHMVTLVLALAAIIYAMASYRPVWRSAVHAINAIYVGIAFLFLFYGMQVLGNITTLPQWSLFAAMVALSATGLWRTKA